MRITRTNETDVCCHGDCLGGRDCPLRPSAKVLHLHMRRKTDQVRPVIVTREQCAAMDDTMGPDPVTPQPQKDSMARAMWLWLPVLTRLALENLARRVDWLRLLGALLCVASSVGVTYALVHWTQGYDLTPALSIPWFR